MKDSSGRPLTLLIGPHPYTVSYEREAIDRASRDHGATVSGHQDSFLNSIAIEPELVPSVAKSTLLHEILHAIFAHFSNGHLMDTDIEEKVVSMLEGPLLMLIVDNPQLVEYLQEGAHVNRGAT